MADRIVVVGGGFAGFWAASAARRVAGDRAEVTLVSRGPRLEMRPRFYEAHPETLAVDLDPLLSRAGVRFMLGEAGDLDRTSRTLLLSSGERLGYERLVVATGSVMRRPPVPGAEAAFSIDTQAEAVVFDRRLAALAGNGAHPAVAVVGAGFTGIELALELRDRLAAHGGTAMGERLRIILLDRADVVGPELGPGPRPAIEAALAAAGVEVRLGVQVSELAAERVTLAGGEALPVDAVVLTTGLVAAPFVDRIPGERDRLGRVIVARTLRAPDAPEVFVAGDAAAADAGDEALTLQSCQHALLLGRYAGENAARGLLNLPLLTYSQTDYVTCLDLGRWGAVYTRGRERTVAHSGAEAKTRKRRINQQLIYPPADATGEELLALSAVDADDE
jgi:NADH dehydrogenase